MLRYIDWTTGTPGQELLENTRMETDDLIDVLNALIDAGFVEIVPYAEKTSHLTYKEDVFEVNPSYALELKTAMQRL